MAAHNAEPCVRQVPPVFVAVMMQMGDTVVSRLLKEQF